MRKWPQVDRGPRFWPIVAVNFYIMPQMLRHSIRQTMYAFRGFACKAKGWKRAQRPLVFITFILLQPVDRRNKFYLATRLASSPIQTYLSLVPFSLLL